MLILHRFHRTLCTVLLLATGAFLLPGLASAANEYVLLPCCPQTTVQDHSTDFSTAVRSPVHESCISNHRVDAVPAVSRCDMCEHCLGYIDAHFTAVSVASYGDKVSPRPSLQPAPTVHVGHTAYSPALPPPRSVFIIH